MRTRVQGTFEGLSGSLSSLSQVPLEGYEIHMGVTTYTEEPCPLVQIQEETGERRIRYDGARKTTVTAAMYTEFLIRLVWHPGLFRHF